VLPGHLVRTASEQGWAELADGKLIRVAEADAFNVIVTADQNTFYQHNNALRSIALVVLSTNRRTRSISRRTFFMTHSTVAVSAAMNVC